MNITEITGIVGRSGSGKTYAAKSIIEPILAANHRVCIIDPTGVWWGLRRLANGAPAFPVVILGGEHGDVPIFDGSGGVAGELVARAKLRQVIVDVSEFTGGEQTRFLTDFFETLYARADRTPLYLALDEADLMAPQNPMPDQRRLQGAVNKIVRRGRVKGFRTIMVTQRPAVIDKSVLSQISTLIAMRLPGPQDRSAIESWVKGNADTERAKEMLDSLASLPVGEGWVWSPADDILERKRFPMITTYDSSRAPEAGEEPAEPPALDDVDLGALRAALAPQEDKAEKGATKKASAAEIAAARDEGYRRGLAEGMSIGREQILDRLRGVIGEIVVTPHEAPHEAPPASQPRTRPHPSPKPAADRQPGTPPGLSSSATRLLTVICERDPVRLAWGQICALAGRKARGGTFNTARKHLLAGYVIESGGVVLPTDAAFSALGMARGQGEGQDMLGCWMAALPSYPANLLSIIVSAAPISKDGLAATANRTPSGGAWNSAMKILRDNELITVDGEMIRVGPALEKAA